MSPARVVVIGAGLVGASAAYRLASAGAQVTVVDRHDRGQATAAGAGIICPGDDDVPAALVPLIQAAAAYHSDLAARLAAEGQQTTGYDVVGALHVATDDAEAGQLPGLLDEIERRRAGGMSHIGPAALVDGAQARALMPALRDVRAAVLMPQAARVDGRALCAALLEAARGRGASVLEAEAELVTQGGHAVGVRAGIELIGADAVIIAGGAWSGAIAARIGGSLPVGPQRGQIVHLGMRGTTTARWPIVLGFGPNYLLTFPVDRVVAGSTWEDAGYEADVTVEGLRVVLDAALRLAPGLRSAVIRELRVGLRPVSADGLPILGPLAGFDNLFVATGHGSGGLLAGPYSGAAVADLAIGLAPAIDLAAFSAARFSV